MKKYKKTLLFLVIPIVVQNLIGFITNLMDSVMISQISEIHFASVSLANQVFFILTLVISGVGGGSNVILSQLWGRKDNKGMDIIIAYAYRITLIIGLIFGMGSMLFPTNIMRLLTTDINLIEYGSQYLSVTGLSFLFFSLSSITTQILRSAKKVNISMMASICAICINVFFNYCLIFGKIGFPELGIVGAGLATTIARFVELCILVGYLFFVESNLNIHIRKMIQLNPVYLHLYATKCFPVALNELMWSLGESFVVAIIGRMGQSMISAIAIYNVVAQLCNIIMNGFDSAACVMIGNTLGKKENSLLFMLINYFKKISFGIGLVDCFFMIMTIPIIPMVYNLSNSTLAILQPILICGGVIEIFKSLQCMNMMGILRGGGDVNFACLNDILFLWCFVLPLGYLGALHFHWHYLMVFVCIKSDQVLKYFTSEYRTRQKEIYQHIEVQNV